MVTCPPVWFWCSLDDTVLISSTCYRFKMLSSSQLVVTIPSLLLHTDVKIVNNTVCQEVAVTKASFVGVEPRSSYMCIAFTNVANVYNAGIYPYMPCL